MVGDLIHRQRDEVGDLQLDHRPRANQRGTDSGAGLTGLRDGRIDHARRPEAVEQPGGDLEESADRGDVLADHEHARVAGHLERERLVEGLRHRELALGTHASLPSAFQSLGA